MHNIKRSFLAVFFVFAFSFVFSTISNAQGVVRYGFLEVIDYSKKPIIEATIDVNASCQGGKRKTGENGGVIFPIGFGDCGTGGFSISKDGYYAFKDYFGIVGVIREKGTAKIELLKIPQNEVERKAIGDEQRKREFFVAAIQGDFVTVRKYLRSGYSPNLTTFDLRGIPARKDIALMMFAARSGSPKTIKEFLDNGADIKSEEGSMPKLLEAYLNATPNYQQKSQTAQTQRDELLDVYEKGAIDLITAGASTDSPELLAVASGKGYLRTVKFLIEKGVLAVKNRRSGQTALLALVYADPSKRRIEIANLLIKSGVDVNAPIVPDRLKCNSLLGHAVKRVDLEMIEFLIKHKADVNLRCNDGSTILSYSIKQRYHLEKYREEIVKILKAAGAK